jgi:integrase
MVHRNVARRSQPPAVYAEEIAAPSEGEVKSLLAVAEESDAMLADLLSLAVLTGARRGELCALRWSDVDEGKRILRIARSLYECEGGGWSEKTTKNGRIRRIALDDVAVEVLLRRRTSIPRTPTARREHAFVFSRRLDGSEPIRRSGQTEFHDS